jgi:ribosomal protein L32
MPILEKTIRVGAIVLAVLFIVLSLFGIFGAWFVDRKATDVALKVFGVIETGVGVVNAGVERVDDLIAPSRTEVRQASETITAAGAQTQANNSVLNALNERLETNLAPHRADAAGFGSCPECGEYCGQHRQCCELASNDG